MHLCVTTYTAFGLRPWPRAVCGYPRHLVLCIILHAAQVEVYQLELTICLYSVTVLYD